MAPAHRTRDEWLVLRCQSGDAKAFEELVREMERPLLYFVQKLLGDHDTSLDVMQDVWIKVFRTLSRLEKPASIRAWLYQTARSLAIDRIRKDAAQRKREQLHADDVGRAWEVPRFGADEAAEIHAALDALDVTHREVLVLGFLEEMSIAEIALVVGCPEGTVKSRIHYAKVALAKALKEKRYAQ